MKRLIDFVRALLISPEAVVILLVVAGWRIAPGWISTAAHYLLEKDCKLAGYIHYVMGPAFLALILMSFRVYAMHHKSSLSAGRNKELEAIADMLQVRTVLSAIWASLSYAIWIVASSIGESLSLALCGALAIGSCAIMAVEVGSTGLALLVAIRLYRNHLGEPTAP